MEETSRTTLSAAECFAEPGLHRVDVAAMHAKDKELASCRNRIEYLQKQLTAMTTQNVTMGEEMQRMRGEYIELVEERTRVEDALEKKVEELLECTTASDQLEIEKAHDQEVIVQVRSEVERLRIELEAKEAILAREGLVLQSFRDSRSRHNLECQKKSTSIATLGDAIVELCDEQRAQNVELDKQNAELEAAIKKLAEQDAILAVREERLQTQSVTITNQAAVIGAQSKTVENHRQYLKVMVEELADKVKQLAVLNKKLEAKSKQLEAKNKDFDTAQATLLKAEAAYVELYNVCADKESDIAGLRADIENRTVEVAEVHKRLAAHIKDFDAKHAALLRAEDARAKLANDCAAKDEKIAKLRAERKSMRTAIAAHIATNDTAAELLNQQSALVTQLRTELEAQAKAVVCTRAHASTAVLEEQAATIIKLSTELEAKSEALQASEQAHSNLVGERDANQKLIAKLRDALSELALKDAAHTATLVQQSGTLVLQLRNQLDEYKLVATSTARSQSEVIQQQAEKLAQLHTELETVKTAANTEWHKMDARLGEKIAQLAEQTKTLGEKNATIVELNELITKHVGTIADKDKVIAVLRAQVEKDTSDDELPPSVLTALLSAAIHQLETERATMIVQGVALRKQDQANAALEKKLTEQSRTLTAQSHTLTEQSKTLHQRDLEVAGLTGEVTQLTEQRTKLTKEVAKLLKQVDALQAKVDRYSERTVNVIDKNWTLQHNDQQQAERIVKLEEQLKALQDKDDLAKQVASLSANLRDSYATIERLNNHAELRQAQLEGCQKDLNETSVSDRLTAANMRVLERERTIQKHEQQITALKSELAQVTHLLNERTERYVRFCEETVTEQKRVAVAAVIQAEVAASRLDPKVKQ